MARFRFSGAQVIRPRCLAAFALRDLVEGLEIGAVAAFGKERSRCLIMRLDTRADFTSAISHLVQPVVACRLHGCLRG